MGECDCASSAYCFPSRSNMRAAHCSKVSNIQGVCSSSQDQVASTISCKTKASGYQTHQIHNLYMTACWGEFTRFIIETHSTKPRPSLPLYSTYVVTRPNGSKDETDTVPFNIFEQSGLPRIFTLSLRPSRLLTVQNGLLTFGGIPDNVQNIIYTPLGESLSDALLCAN